MKKYDKIRYVSEFPEMLDITELICEVKYDGSNGRMTFEDIGYIFGTRNLEGEEVSDTHFLLFFDEIRAKIDKLSIEERLELIEILKEYVVFFEMIGEDNLHKLHYDIDKDFIVFDGYHKESHMYVSTDDKNINRVCELLNLTKAKRLEFKTYNQAKEWLYKQEGTKIEGVVLKYYPLQLYCKILHPENREIESAKFKKSKTQARGLNYYDSLFLHTYVTKNRIHKIMFNLRATRMQDIKQILHELWLDLIIECISPFIIKYHREAHNISLAYIKKNYPKIAVSFIKEIIQEGVNWDESSNDQ